MTAALAAGLFPYIPGSQTCQASQPVKTHLNPVYPGPLARIILIYVSFGQLDIIEIESKKAQAHSASGLFRL